MIDLHLHTIHSDGTDTVEELLKNAEKSKLEIISITDHDSVGAYYELENNRQLRDIFSGQIVVGAELATIYNKVNIEILAYGIDLKKLRIQKMDTLQIQKEALAHLKKVADSLCLMFDEKLEIDPEDTNKQFAGELFAEELLRHKENQQIIQKIGPFYHKNIPGPRVGGRFFRVHEYNPRSPFYFDMTKYYKSVNEVIDDIHEAGGLAFLAHGFEYSFEDKEKTIEEILCTTNIDGAECEYPSFTASQRHWIKSVCQKHNKLMSGGSDYHAKKRPEVHMGTGINNNLKIPKSLVANWVRATI